MSSQKINRYYLRAYLLAWLTIGYNLVEGGVSTYFGATDKTLALLGFGIDSFVEVLSGIGIVHMIWRIRRNPHIAQPDKFEITALRITGTAFYLLTVGLIVGAAWAIYTAARPNNTIPGVVISLLSIAIMYALYRAKLKVGQELNSTPIISDAKCTLTCFYLSFILLAASGLYAWFNIPYIDALGSLGIAWYAFKEGREAFEKATSRKLACADDDCC